jgi:carboxymethylenebutenolidase
MTDIVLDLATQWVAVPNDRLTIDAYLARPAAEGVFPAVLVIQEIFGVNAHIREVTERIARLGYVAIAPAIYQRQAPGFEAAYTEADIVQGRAYKQHTRVEEVLSDLTAAIAHLRSLPQVKPGGMGCIGFCFGGHVAYLAATLPDVRATASFYGAGIPTWCPGDGAPTLSYTPRITGTLHAFFGDDDASIPLEHVRAIAAALEQHQIDHHIHCYPGAQHGFFCDRRASYHPQAAAAAWEIVQTLFQQTL